MKQCPMCKFKNVWQKSIDHHIFYSKDELHRREREALIKTGWTLDYKYNNIVSQ
jgi:hypothetical protein